MTQIISYLERLFIKLTGALFTRFVGYYDGDLYRFVMTHDGLILTLSESDFNPKFMIVASCCYQEQRLSFPIDNRQEVNKLLKLQLQHEEVALIQQISEGHSKTNSWLFANSVPKAWLRIPESFVLGRRCEKGEILELVSQDNKIGYVTCFDGVIFSAAKQGLINNSHRFAISAGVALQKTHIINFESKAQVLLTATKQLNLFQLIPFFKKPHKNEIQSVFTQFFISGVSIALLYLMLTSSYLLINNYLLTNKLENYSEQVNHLLLLQDSIESKQNNYLELNQFMASKKEWSSFWIVLAPLLERAQISNIVLKNDAFLVRGQTQHATALLEFISKNPNVKSAKFETPVRKDRRTERFNLSFKLNNTLTFKKPENPNKQDNNS